MFATHYWRKPLGDKRLQSPLETLIYSHVGDEEVRTLENIVGRVLQYIRDHPREISGVRVTADVVENVLRAMVRASVIGEVHGLRLKKFLQSI